MMALSPEQLRLVADWLAAEASDPSGAATTYPERCDLALQSLAQALEEFAYFKEGRIVGKTGASSRRHLSQTRPEASAS